MIKSVFAAGASALALVLAAPASAQSELPELDFGTWGFNPDTLDQAVEPGDDFFAFANGKWIAENPIPAEFTRFGAFDALGEKSRTDVKKLIDDLVAGSHAPGSPEQRVVDAYQAFLDTEAIDAQGMVPAYPVLTAIYSARSLEDLAALFPKAGFPSLVAAGVTVDAKDPNSYIASVGFDGMGLPDRDLYLVDNERNREIQAKYRDYLAFLLGKAGYEDPAATAAAVYAFEHKVAELEWARTAMRNRDLTYNKLTRAELLALAPGFPLARLLDEGGMGAVQDFLVPQLPPSAEETAELGLSEEMLSGIGGGLPAMMELLEGTPLTVLQAYMAAHFLNAYSAYLPSEIDRAEFEFYGKVLNGQEEQLVRWKRAISATQGQLGEVLGELYVEHYFPPESKAAMVDLVENLRKALAASIEENDWMSDATKPRAIAKLEAFTPKIGYPVRFETYEGLEIGAGSPLANAMSAASWQRRKDLSRLGQPVDRDEWFMLPQTVNAYYNPTMNEIVFPAAILQPPFFGLSADMAVNYGGIGGVIGHEMGHGFDDQGSKYDADGTLRNWWAPEDLTAFTDRGDRLVAQYNGYCPLDEGETCVNGRLTLGENIGDVGGLSIAYRAYKMALGGKEAPIIDGLTGDQRFFLAWAQVWRAGIRDNALRQRLLTDPHSPAEFRVNGTLRNQDAWYTAFGVEPGDALYLPPEERVHIW